jgi:hypothetical protein
LVFTGTGAGEVYELKNMKIILKRIPAQIVVALLYGMHYDIHAAQSGISGTPEGERMARVYGHATKYPNESEHCYSYIQVITACTASFAHGANDVGNAVGPWAVIYSAWSTGSAAESEAVVPIWQLAVLSATISIGLITYGFNIMKVMGNKITYHSPSRGKQLAVKTHECKLTLLDRIVNGDGRRHHGAHVLALQASGLDFNVHYRCYCRRWLVQWQLQSRQLAADWSSWHLVDSYYSDRWHSCWSDNGDRAECATLSVWRLIGDESSVLCCILMAKVARI